MSSFMEINGGFMLTVPVVHLMTVPVVHFVIVAVVRIVIGGAR